MRRQVICAHMFPMSILAKSVYAFVAASLVLLSDCSGGGHLQAPISSTAFQQRSIHNSPDFARRATLSVLIGAQLEPRLGNSRPGFVDSAALATSRRKIAVSDASNEVVNVYDVAGTELAQLTGFFEPQGLSSDASGNLFVADTDNQRVQIYAAGLKNPPTTLADSVGFPSDVDSMSSGKIVAVANIYNAPCCAQGSVSFFTRGVLSNTISNATLAKAYFCAFDAIGNLYVDGLDVNNNFVMGVIIGGANGRQFTQLSTDNTIRGPGAVQVTTSGQIAILDQIAATVYTYNAPKNGSLGSPVSSTPLTQAVEPVTFAFTKTMTQLYTADAGIFASQQFVYPTGGDATSTINVGGQAIGVTLFPAQRPIHTATSER